MAEENVEEIRVDLNKTDKALKGEFCSVKINNFLRRSDKVYKWVDESEIRIK